MPFVLFRFCKRAEEPSRAYDNVNISSSRYETKTSCRAPYRKKGRETAIPPLSFQLVASPPLRIDSECAQPTRRFFCGMSVCREKREKKKHNDCICNSFFFFLSILSLLICIFSVFIQRFPEFKITFRSGIRDDHGSKITTPRIYRSINGFP